jgi:hypothetical protein
MNLTINEEFVFYLTYHGLYAFKKKFIFGMETMALKRGIIPKR